MVPLPSTIELRSAALDYARLGWWIVPLHDVTTGRCSCGQSDCSSPGKHPRTPHGLSEASTDPATVAYWWDVWPRANIGCVCGRSNLTVIDVDVKKGAQGEANIRWFVTQFEVFSRTFLVGTPTGGFHYYFSGHNKTSHGTLRPGLDVQGEGAYVLLPPSVAFSRYDAAKNPIPDSQLPYQVLRSAPILPYPLTEQRGYDFGEQQRMPEPEARARVPYGAHRAALVRHAWYLRRVQGFTVDVALPMLEDFIKSGVLEGYDQRHPFTRRDLEGMLSSVPANVATDMVPLSNNVLDALDTFDTVIKTKPTPRQVIIPGLMIQGELHVFYGRDGTKKTTLAAYLLALVTKQGRDVLVFISEDQPRDFARKFELAGGDTNRFVVFNSSKFKGDFLLPKHKASLETIIQSRQWGCVYFDSINDFKSMDGRLNAADEARQMFAPLQTMAQQYDTAVLCTLHTNARDVLEGSRQIQAKARVVARVEKPKVDEDDSGYDFSQSYDPDFTAIVTTSKFSRGVARTSYAFHFDISIATDEVDIQPGGERTPKEHFICTAHTPMLNPNQPKAGRPRIMEIDDLTETVNRMVAETPNISGNAVFKAVGGDRNKVMALVRQAKQR